MWPHLHPRAGRGGGGRGARPRRNDRPQPLPGCGGSRGQVSPRPADDRYTRWAETRRERQARTFVPSSSGLRPSFWRAPACPRRRIPRQVADVAPPRRRQSREAHCISLQARGAKLSAPIEAGAQDLGHCRWCPVVLALCRAWRRLGDRPNSRTCEPARQSDRRWPGTNARDRLTKAGPEDAQCVWRDGMNLTGGAARPTPLA